MYVTVHGQVHGTIHGVLKCFYDSKISMSSSTHFGWKKKNWKLKKSLLNMPYINYMVISISSEQETCNEG